MWVYFGALYSVPLAVYLFCASAIVFFLKLCIYFWLFWVLVVVPGLFMHGLFIVVHGLSLVAMNRGYSLVAVYRLLLIEVASVLWIMGSRACRLSNGGAWA